MFDSFGLFGLLCLLYLVVRIDVILMLGSQKLDLDAVFEVKVKLKLKISLFSPNRWNLSFAFGNKFWNFSFFKIYSLNE